jgi:hypothetical protein
MSRDITKLTEEFQADLGNLLKMCSERGVEMRPYYTERTPWEQARLWRQSRPTSKIELVSATLRTEGAKYLSKVLEEVGPCNGPHVTNSCPGNSWHQFGLAVDCFWNVQGDSEWSPTVLIKEKNGYQVYSDAALELNLRPGSSWGDWPHVQKPKESAPQKVMTWENINDLMFDKFGNDETKHTTSRK